MPTASRQTTWTAAQVLTAAALNGEFDHFLSVINDIDENNIDLTATYAWTGAHTHAGTVTVGVNDAGHDVKFFGATSGAYLLWDEDVDDLKLVGAAGLIVPDGQFTLGSTAVTTTGAELNLIDGGTARGTNAVASGDGILINDAGTMRMINVDTVSTYFSSHNVGGGNIVTTGALNSGSITSGFGTIDTGSSTITTTGVITGGGFTIGSAVIGEAELEIIDGATVTTTELNLIDGGTPRGTDAVATGDGLLVNDGGTMKMTNVDTVSTYFASHSVGGSNIATVGTITSGAWQSSTKVASAYLDDDTAHLSTTQTFTGAKTFSAAASFSDDLTVDTRTLFVDASANCVGIGALTPSVPLTINQTADAAGIMMEYNTGTNENAPRFEFRKSRGTAEGHTTAVVDDDELGRIAWQGYDGTNPINGAYIRCFVDGTPGSNDMPGRLSFWTTADGAASPTERMKILSTGNVEFGSNGFSMNTVGRANAQGVDIGIGVAPSLNIPLSIAGFHGTLMYIRNYQATAEGPNVIMGHSRNATFGSLTATNTDDQLGKITCNGVDTGNTSFRTAGAIQFIQTASDATTVDAKVQICPGRNTDVAMTVLTGGNVDIVGALSKGSGSFKIDHPLEAKKDTHNLIHSFIEGPQADLIYRGVIELTDGSAQINIDTASGMTEGTFVALNRGTQVFTTNESNWDAVKGTITGNILTIESDEAASIARISWMVVGERCDQHMIDTDWTDAEGGVIVEPEKTDAEKAELKERLN